MNKLTHEELLRSARAKAERFDAIGAMPMPRTIEEFSAHLHAITVNGLTGAESGVVLEEFFRQASLPSIEKEPS